MKDGEILTKRLHDLQGLAGFYSNLILQGYDCNDASVSSGSEMLSFDITDGGLV